MPENRKETDTPSGVELSTDKTEDNPNAKPKSSNLSPQEKRIALIAAMGQFRPNNATPIQFYNYVREFCIMHNCSIDEAMEKAPESWSKLTMDHRELYNSEVHAALPIPVPPHLVYRAFQMERAGRWKLSSTPAGNGGSVMYSVESYAPPTKPTRMQARIRSQQPRFDNLAESSPCYLESPRHATTAKKSRTLTPPEQRAQKAQQQEKNARAFSLTRMLSEVSVKGGRKGREAGGDADVMSINDRTKKPVKSKNKSRKSIGDDKEKKKKTPKKTATKTSTKTSTTTTTTNNGQMDTKRKQTNTKHKRKL